MSQWTIFHNPRCSKSRQALKILKDHGVEPQVVEYLKTPLGAEEIKDVCTKLGLRPSEIVRKKEDIFRQLKLDLDEEEKVVQAIAKHPKLLERPIVVKGERAVVGRPPENVKELL